MTYQDAQIILDRCRAGEPVTIAQINAALEMTGDLEHVALSMADAQGVA